MVVGELPPDPKLPPILSGGELPPASVLSKPDDPEDPEDPDDPPDADWSPDVLLLLPIPGSCGRGSRLQAMIPDTATVTHNANGRTRLLTGHHAVDPSRP